jgi:tripeptide aminopeptidase
MSTETPPVDVKSAQEHLIRFLLVQGVTGQEKAIAEAVTDELKKVGVPAAIRFDTANQRIPLPTQTGNLLIDLPGTRRGPRLLFATHLDTLPLCAGARPRREDGRRRHQRCHRLRPHQGRGAQPRRRLRRDHREGVRGGV